LWEIGIWKESSFCIEVVPETRPLSFSEVMKSLLTNKKAVVPPGEEFHIELFLLQVRRNP